MTVIFLPGIFWPTVTRPASCKARRPRYLANRSTFISRSKPLPSCTVAVRCTPARCHKTPLTIIDAVGNLRISRNQVIGIRTYIRSICAAGRNSDTGMNCCRTTHHPDTKSVNWRGILEYFLPAVQLGLTATPKLTHNADK